MKCALVLALAACGRIGFTESTGSIGADAAPDGGLPSAGCSTASLLADDFSGATTSPQWYTYANGSITTVQTGGELVITLPATTQSTAKYGGYGSAWHYDLRGSRAFVQVLQTEAAATNAQTDLQIDSPGGDFYEIAEENGHLSASLFVATGQTTLAMIPYSPSAHAWWQFREDQGTIYFETSSDGVTFTAFASTPTPVWASTAGIAVEAGSFQVETDPGASRFDNFNGGVASGTWCKASTLRDDFHQNTIDNRWGNAYMNGGCSYTETSGAFVVTLTPAGTEDCALVSSNGYDLTGDMVFAELAQAPSTAGATFSYLRASTVTGDNVEIAQASNSIVAAQNIGGTYTTLHAAPYDPAQSFIRLTEIAGQLGFDTSPDGASWNNLFTTASPISLVGVNLSIGAGTNSAVTAPGSATFATFDQLPP
jgi:hypothetical protein